MVSRFFDVNSQPYLTNDGKTDTGQIKIYRKG
jgi:hypothetical protein